MANEVCEGNDGKQAHAEQKGGVGVPLLPAQALLEEEKVENDENNHGQQIDEEDVGTVDSVFVVVQATASVCAKYDGLVLEDVFCLWIVELFVVQLLLLEVQRQGFASEVVTHNQGEVGDGNGEDKEPRQKCDDVKERLQNAIEEDVEDEPPRRPSSSSKKTSFDICGLYVARIVVVEIVVVNGCVIVVILILGARAVSQRGVRGVPGPSFVVFEQRFTL